MADPDNRTELEKLKALEERIAKLKGPGPEGRPQSEEHYSQATIAWRMVTELVAGLGIGFGIGYGLDALFGTRPFLMVLFIFLGFAAGIKTMMRTAQEAQTRAQAGQETGSDNGGNRS